MNTNKFLAIGVGVAVLGGGLFFLMKSSSSSTDTVAVTTHDSEMATSKVVPDMTTASVGLATDPTISIDAAEVTQGTPITVTWDKNTNSTTPCYYITTPLGFGGMTPASPFKIETKNRLGNGAISIYCKSLTGGNNFSKTLQFYVRPSNPNPSTPTAPVVQAQLTGTAFNFGDKITFKWNAMGGKNCSYFVPAARATGELDASSTTFSVDTSSFYRSRSPLYGLFVSCKQNSGSSLSSEFTYWQMNR